MLHVRWKKILMSKKEKNKPDLNFAKYSGIAFQMGATIFLGIWGGIQLDKLVNASFPYFTLSLSLIGVFAAIYFAIKDVINK